MKLGEPCRNKHTSTKPWQLKRWRERRADVIKRANSCEWCGSSFSDSQPAVVNHLKENYKKPDGTMDWDAYIAMKDDEVAVICKGCHLVWTRTGKRRKLPQ